jgi:hypothetical protein
MIAMINWERNMNWIARKLHFFSAIGAPIRFAFGTGHFLSAIKSRAVDRYGDPLPWYTYPVIDFLTQLDFASADVLEFGGGQSTLWWTKRARSVVCMESNPMWCEALSKKVNGQAQINHVSSPNHAARILDGRTFDIIVIDDGSGVGPHGREANAKTAFASLRPEGMIVVDNSDAAYCRPILEEANQIGYSRIDFAGWTPGSFGKSCTTLLFLEPPGRLRYKQRPRV